MEKIEKKPPENHTNSLKTGNNNANSYSPESRQQEQGSDYNNGAMSLRNEDKNTTMMPDPMKKLNKVTENCVLRKGKRKAYAEAIQPDPLEVRSVDIPPIGKRKRKTYAEVTNSDLREDKSVALPLNVGIVDAESGKRSLDLEAIKKALLSAEHSSFLKFLILLQMFVWIHLCPITPLTLFLGLLRLSQYAIYIRHGGVRNFRRIGK